jgi:hypothetical protein
VSEPSAAAGIGDSPGNAPAKRLGVPYQRYFWVLAGAWTAIAAASLIWNLVQHAKEVSSVAAEAARVLLEKDMLYREWSILHGGVYVADAAPERSAAAMEEERQVRTPSGRILTLLNPAVVSRQMFEIQNQRLGIQGHITSLQPVRPANLPDTWERQVLQAFEKGRPETSVIENRQGARYFRLMRPLRVNASCLHCHEEQGRKVGEVRGGISVAVPMSRFTSPGENARLVVAHVGLWLVGLAGLLFAAASLQKHLQARQRAEAEREQLIVKLQEALANVKTLRGLIPICSSCKKIRNDQGYWTQLETYLKQHSDAEFSHGLCVDCLRKLYPDVSGQVEARLAKQAPPKT